MQATAQAAGEYLRHEEMIIDKFLFGLILAISLHAFDDIAIITMLPVVVEQLDGQHLFGASFFAYLLASLVSLVWAGAITDREGPRRPLITGLAIFIVGLLVGGLSTSMEQFVFGRALQGLGGGAMHSVVFASINLAYEESRRKRAIAFLTTAWIMPALLAPMIAGYITQHWDWHWVFLGMIPFAVGVGFITFNRLGSLAPVAADRTSSGENSRQLLGVAVRIALGIGLLLTAISLLQGAWLCILSVTGFLIFWKPLNTVFPRGIWTAQPGLSAALVLKFLLIFCFFGTETFIPTLLKHHFGYTPFQAGSVITGAALAWTIATWLYESNSTLFRSKSLLIMGCSTLCLGLILLLTGLTVIQQPLVSYFAWIVTAFGMGLAYPLTMMSAMSNTQAGNEGHTSTAAGMVDALGFSFSSGIGGALLNLTAARGWLMVDSVQLIWLLMIFVAILLIGISVTKYVEPG